MRLGAGSTVLLLGRYFLLGKTSGTGISVRAERFQHPGAGEKRRILDGGSDRVPWIHHSQYINIDHENLIAVGEVESVTVESNDKGMMEMYITFREVEDG